ncbi:MAG TPA: transposase [Terriglobales bacterium]|nr:transposase [Terriglobales bacterium]
MSHSYNSNLVHAFFATKERQPLIPEDRQENLWAYFVGIGKNLGCPVMAAGGTENHVHLLFVLDQKIALSTAMQKFKANSSRWMAEHGEEFSWQEGFGALSVSPSQAPCGSRSTSPTRGSTTRSAIVEPSFWSSCGQQASRPATVSSAVPEGTLPEWGTALPALTCWAYECRPAVRDWRTSRLSHLQVYRNPWSRFLPSLATSSLLR